MPALKISALKTHSLKIPALKPGSTLLACLLLSISQTALAYDYVHQDQILDADSLTGAIKNGQPGLDARLRYEDVRPDALVERGGQALTLRTRLGFHTQRYKQFSAYVQLENISAIGGNENYDSGKNGESDDSFIGDPERTRFSEAWLRYDILNTALKYGRQTYQLNAGRILGADPWRQNEQTFTGFTLVNESFNYTKFEAAQLNYISQPYIKAHGRNEAPINAHVFNLAYRGFLLNDLSLYHVGIEEFTTNRLWETHTTGLYFAGKAGGNSGHIDRWGRSKAGEDFSLEYSFEFALQSDAGKNPNNYHSKYLSAQLSFGYNGFTLNLGHESLGAEAGGYFVTPLANLHDYQGWSDQLVSSELGNHEAGIVDQKVGVSYSCSDYFLSEINYHHYDSKRALPGGKDLGAELEARLGLKLENYHVQLKFADYRAKLVGGDTQKIWLQAGLSF